MTRDDEGMMDPAASFPTDLKARAMVTVLTALSDLDARGRERVISAACAYFGLKIGAFGRLHDDDA